MKRFLDITIATLALLLTSPVLAVACIFIMIESPGSPIYRQRRVGRGGKDFELIKLRTMVHGAEKKGKGLIVEKGDVRILRIGTFLRRFSLDELPNFVNVLRGELSVVGPRPTVRTQVERYTEAQTGRLSVKPGITGWAQVNGRAALPWSERIELDLWYVKHQSTLLDLKILGLTAKMLVTGHGLYSGEDGAWRDP